MSRSLKTILTGGDQPGRVAALGIQHVFAMFGSTVLVPALTGLNPAVTLLCMGIGTLIFHLVTRGIVPAFMGSSFSFIAAITAVGKYCADHSIENFASYVGWGIMASGVLYILFALAVKVFGAARIISFFPPVVTGCMIIIIGTMLAPTAMSNISTTIADIPVWKNWLVAAFTVAVIVVVMFFGRGFLKLIPILLGVISGYLLALALGMVDTVKVAEAGWLSVPKISLPAVKDWGAIGYAVSMIAPISLVTFVEHIGEITANGAVTGKNYFEDPGLHRTLLGCGLASIFSGAMGGPAATTYAENTGVLAATRNYNPAVLRAGAVFAILLSLLGKVSGVLNSIPAPVMGGVSIILFGMITSVGLRMLIENGVDFKENHNLIIAAVMLVIGLGLTNGIVIGSVEITGTSIAAVLGVVLNKLLPKEKNKSQAVAKE